MTEYMIEIDIDENGDVKAETKGMCGEICVNELDEILNGIDGERSNKNKPEFYQKIKIKNVVNQKAK
ncbi:MAG: DUF2997 domain-containing protein [Spirochaetales bacterium]|nr:DUF2997 domain-containing protein [Spirochaetales bacterium]